MTIAIELVEKLLMEGDLPNVWVRVAITYGPKILKKNFSKKVRYHFSFYYSISFPR
jgi:hypothetical protein